VAELSVCVADPTLRSALGRAVDREGKIARALESLGSLSGRSALVLDAEEGSLVRRLADLGVRARGVAGLTPPGLRRASTDAIVVCWSGFRGDDADAQLALANRVVRPGGRLLVVHDYGRDDVSALFADDVRERELVAWSRPRGPFLGRGFRLRVLHCWWSWDTLDEATALLGQAFGARGERLAATMRRPRLAYKVAVYHRVLGRAADAGEAA
jgi:hypothetical protein